MAHIGGIAMLAGVGFTLSIFIADLAFGDNTTLINAAKLSIFSASIVSGIGGIIWLLIASRSKRAS